MRPRSVELVAHPSTPCDAVASLTVAVTRPFGDALRLVYRLSGALERIVVPPWVGSQPRDELWRHTCFEAFLAAPGGETYEEVNASPSGESARYAFGAYRERVEAGFRVAPRIETRRPAAGVLEVDVRVSRVPNADLVLGLSAVVESKDGPLSYWAITHPGERPDFHDRRGFVLRVEAAEP